MGFGVRAGIVYILMSWDADLQTRQLVQVRAFHFLRPMLFQIELGGQALSNRTEVWGSYSGQDLRQGCILVREALEAAFRDGEARFALRLFECDRTRRLNVPTSYQLGWLG